MELVQITPEGLKPFQYNLKRRKDYHVVVGADQRVEVKKDETAIVLNFPSLDAADLYFMDEKKIDVSWRSFRKRCVIGPDVTSVDVKRAFENDPFIRPFLRSNYTGDGISGSVTLRKKLVIAGGVLTCHYFAVPEEDQQASPTKVSLDRVITLTQDGVVTNLGRCEWTLIDVIRAMYSWGNAGEQVRITKAGLLQPNGEICSKNAADLSSPFDFLMRPCLVDEGVTLGDVFAMVEGDASLKFFISNYVLAKDVGEFHQTASLPPNPPYRDPLLSLRCYGEGEVDDDGFVDMSDFEGLSAEEQYDLTAAPMADIVNLPLIVDPKYEIKFYENFKVARVVSANRTYTLLEILNAIYWEISFFGSPLEINRARKDVRLADKAFRGDDDFHDGYI